jgi:hypothetical protein
VSSIAYAKCDCCTRTFGFVLESSLTTDVEAPPLCGMCQVRGRLCLHNIFERSANREPGDPPVPFHSTSPHTGMQEFADDPASCPACIAARRRTAEMRKEKK